MINEKFSSPQNQKAKKDDFLFEKKLIEENSIFSSEQIAELSQIFQFFMNPKSKLLNLKDLIVSLKSLGYFESHAHFENR